MQLKEDIFDKMMHLPILNIFEPFYKKNKEVLLYLFFGVLAFLVSILTYALFNVLLGMNELLANLLSWIITVFFAFITNSIWVFQADISGVKKFIDQMGAFYGGRIITLVIEEVILFVFISMMNFPSMLIKVVAQIIVILLNYIISKLLVFKK